MSKNGKAPSGRGPAGKSEPLDLASVGYPVVRAAFNAILRECTDKLSDTEWSRAYEVLGLEDGDLGGESGEEIEFLTDAALFSRPVDTRTLRMGKSAIDRIASKLKDGGDPLRREIIAALPQALFSCLEVTGKHPEEGLTLVDLLDGKRCYRLVDEGLQASTQVGSLFAGRFLPLGSRLVGFGIVIGLRKSEATAIRMVHANVEEWPGGLHEIIYTCRLHGIDLIVEVLRPMLEMLALSIDGGVVDADQIVAQFSPPSSKD
jgi:hypothetical protein